MDAITLAQPFVVLAVVLLLARPLGRYIVGVYFKKQTRMDQVFEPIENLIFRVVGVHAQENMGAKRYLVNLLVTNAIMWGIFLLIMLGQGALPLNPANIPNMPIDLAINTASSFITTTNWQNYAGETSMSYLSQMIGVTFLNFTAAATGMAIAVALMRGFSKKGITGYRDFNGIGNFYFDFVRSITRVLIPLAFVFSIILLLGGVPQTLAGPVNYTTFQGDISILYRGPVASMEAIEHIGNNGGGFFGQNSANPYENPSPATNFVEMLTMLLISVSFIYAFGVVVGNTKEGWILIGALSALFIAFTLVAIIAESSNPALIGVNQSLGNLEGKEVRFGTVGSALFETITTATATGSVNSMHDSYTPVGGAVAFGLMFLNSVFGGAGCGLINIVMFVILAVFISGLMVGRTPQYLGRKIESYEIKLTVWSFLVHPILIFTFTSLAIIFASNAAFNPGFQGFSEIAYAFTSCAANNGSAFAGFAGNTPFLNYTLAITMVMGRYITFILMLLVAEAFMRKKIAPYDLGTFRTDTWLFGLIFVGVLVIINLLTFFPVLIFGPIGEFLSGGVI
jgi:K+-transporting ATPase ATPase A chain